jgi:hypothetical protein
MHGPTCIFWANLTPFSLQCTLRQDFAAGGAGNTTQLIGDAKTLDECCDACAGDPACKLFVGLPQKIDGHTCMLYTALNTSADRVVQGAVSGSPQRNHSGGRFV